MTEGSHKKLSDQEIFMNTIERLNILLPHWNDHNGDHIKELERWMSNINVHEFPELHKSIENAVSHMHRSQSYLEYALEHIKIAMADK